VCRGLRLATLGSFSFDAGDEIGQLLQSLLVPFEQAGHDRFINLLDCFAISEVRHRFPRLAAAAVQ
jgi:hypothetical protein